MAQVRTFVAAFAFLALAAPIANAQAQEANARAQACTGFAQAERTGSLQNEAIDEASGLAASWRHEGLLWVHNDSGDEPRLFLMKADGSHVATITLAGVNAHDWEDVAVGPCAKASKQSCVYVADIGDNRAQRKEVVIHRFAEPALGDERPADITVKKSTSTWFTYPGGARDAEALMVHPTSAKVYVVEKTSERDPGVYRVPRKSTTAKKPTLAVEVGQLRFGAQSGFGKLITAGDISPDGTEFTVRTYLAAYTFCASDEASDEKGADFESAVEATPVLSNPPFMIQSETLGYSRDGETIWVTSERRPAPLYRMQREKPEPEDAASKAGDD